MVQGTLGVAVDLGLHFLDFGNHSRLKSIFDSSFPLLAAIIAQLPSSYGTAVCLLRHDNHQTPNDRNINQQPLSRLHTMCYPLNALG